MFFSQELSTKNASNLGCVRDVFGSIMGVVVNGPVD